MSIGDAIRITTEFGKDYYENKAISGLIGIATLVCDGVNGQEVGVLLSNGVEFQCCSPWVWLEVLG